MDLEVRHLRAICAIADAGSLSQAAVRLGVSQPAITVLLQRMEHELGAELFVRDRTGSHPTPLGERALRQARLLLADLESFAADLSDGGTAPALARVGSAHLACIDSVVDNLDIALRPNGFTLRVEPSAVVLVQLLDHDQVDIALVCMMEDQQVPLPAHVSQRTVVPRLPIFVALATTHPLSRRPVIGLADLSGETWICPPGAEDGSLASLRDGCRRAGFIPHIRFEVPSGAGRQLIEAGHAIQLVEPGCIASERLAVRPIDGDPFRARLVLAWNRRKFTASAVRSIYQAVGRAYAGHASRSPHYAPWWEAHPEVHPWTD